MAYPEVSTRLSWEWIKLALRSRSLEPIKQPWNSHILRGGYVLHSGRIINHPVSSSDRGL
jgi:hypothetical protein